MDRAAYNECMRPWMSGSKTKQQRQHDMCVGAKVCSKGMSKEEAETICNQPKMPKWAKKLIPDKEENISCPERLERVKGNLEVIDLKMKVGEASEVIDAGALVLHDLLKCSPDPSLYTLAEEAMGGLSSLSKGYYLKGQTKDIENQMRVIKEMLP